MPHQGDVERCVISRAASLRPIMRCHLFIPRHADIPRQAAHKARSPEDETHNGDRNATRWMISDSHIHSDDHFESHLFGNGL